MDIKKTAVDIIKEVGGAGNIESVTHCVTRLRFVLRDFSIPDKETVANIDGVISVIQQGGQYQVVIGNEVSDVYDVVMEELGEHDSVDKIEKKDNHVSLFGSFTSMISGIFMPAIGALAGSGIIKGVLAILVVANVLSEQSGTYLVLYGLSNAFFYFMPILLGVSAARYFKLDMFVGGLIGAALISPTLLPFATSGGLDFLGIKVNMLDYTSSVFPVIVAVWFASKVSIVADKIVTKSLKFLFVPAIVLLISVPLALLVIGPIITFLGNILADVITTIYNFSPTLAGIAIGGPWILMVMLGLHWAFIPIFLANLATQGSDPIMGLLLANQFAMAGATIAIGLKTKNKELKALSLSTGGTTLFGISEPALYGVLIPHKKTLVAAIIGGSVGGMVAGLSNTVQYGFGGSGLLGIPLIINTSGIDSGFYGGIASQIIGFLVGFILTYAWGFRDKKVSVATTTSLKNTTIEPQVIIQGDVVSLAEVPDKVFSEGLMGPGLAVYPKAETIYAPFDGKVTALFPTKHAIGITSQDGVELLVHVGVDTVELNGLGFETYVDNNQEIKKGDPLIHFNRSQIKEKGYSDITSILVTNAQSFAKVNNLEHKIELQK